VSGARFVVLGLAPARASWFREVAQWANTGMIAAEFVKCLSAEEVRARLASGRPFSALLVDATLPALDRDLIDSVRARGCGVIVVDDPRRGTDWTAFGAATTLPARFERTELISALNGHVPQIARADRSTVRDPKAADIGWRAPVIAVTGPGGTGASTVAIALAQGLAADVRAGGAVVLADFCLDAELAMLHDASDVVPGVQELVEGFRSGRPTADEIRDLTFAVPERGYRLLLGVRRARAWSTIRPRAFDAALDGLRTAFRYVVADVGADVEGEDDGGSIDVEERNHMARSTLRTAEAVFAVGSPGMKGTHSLTRVISALLGFGVADSRIVTVVNRGPRPQRQRLEIVRTIEQLLPARAGADIPPPLFLPERHIDDALRDTVRLPDALAGPLATSCRSVTERTSETATRHVAPARVTPGTLGRWTPELEPQ